MEETFSSNIKTQKMIPHFVFFNRYTLLILTGAPGAPSIPGGPIGPGLPWNTEHNKSAGVVLRACTFGILNMRAPI